MHTLGATHNEEVLWEEVSHRGVQAKVIRRSVHNYAYDDHLNTITYNKFDFLSLSFWSNE